MAARNPGPATHARSPGVPRSRAEGRRLTPAPVAARHQRQRKPNARNAAAHPRTHLVHPGRLSDRRGSHRARGRIGSSARCRRSVAPCSEMNRSHSTPIELWRPLADVCGQPLAGIGALEQLLLQLALDASPCSKPTSMPVLDGTLDEDHRLAGATRRHELLRVGAHFARSARVRELD